MPLPAGCKRTTAARVCVRLTAGLPIKDDGVVRIGGPGTTCAGGMTSFGLETWGRWCGIV